jgi:hypothetical protein
MLISMTMDVPPFWETNETHVAQGREGQQVREEIAFVKRHWYQQSPHDVEWADANLLDELINYRPVPFERVAPRPVRYVRINDLQPRKIVFDEDAQ